MSDTSPFNPIPPLVLAVFAALIVPELLFTLGEAGVLGGATGLAWRVDMIDRYAFAPRALELLWQGRWDFDIAIRFLSYAFVHGSFTHGAFAAVLWIALGKFASEVYRPWAVAVIALVSVLAGSVAYGIYGIQIHSNVPLVGAYPADYGMIGAFTYLTWLRLGQEGGNPMFAFAMIGALMVLQLVFSALFGANPTWMADMAGFVVGGITSILVAPGGWQAFLARIRTR